MEEKIHRSKFVEYEKYNDEKQKKLCKFVKHDKKDETLAYAKRISKDFDGLILHKYLEKTIKISSFELNKLNDHHQPVEIYAKISKILSDGEYDNKMDYFVFRLSAKNNLFPNGNFIDIVVAFNAYRKSYYDILNTLHPEGKLASKLIIIDDVLFFYNIFINNNRLIMSSMIA
jgi:hypothetical protein